MSPAARHIKRAPELCPGPEREPEPEPESHAEPPPEAVLQIEAFMPVALIAERKPPSRTAIRALEEVVSNPRFARQLCRPALDSGLYYSRPSGAARSSFGFVNAYSPGETTPQRGREAVQLDGLKIWNSAVTKFVFLGLMLAAYPSASGNFSCTVDIRKFSSWPATLVLHRRQTVGSFGNVATACFGAKNSRGQTNTSATGQIYNARAATRTMPLAIGHIYKRDGRIPSSRAYILTLALFAAKQV
ncbi:hypothetical protein DFH07DRAFT_1012682 [Mycena maculata]|uniref:Uncharacterized protein n=1 Tax=Mycena maculata TaxID=230809 RepID=A0AAD7MHA1_9AGAR|nr:hypothetical protein DFH07DRAFT_1012682 [Mycena maculata]